MHIRARRTETRISRSVRLNSRPKEASLMRKRFLHVCFVLGLACSSPAQPSTGRGGGSGTGGGLGRRRAAARTRPAAPARAAPRAAVRQAAGSVAARRDRTGGSGTGGGGGAATSGDASVLERNNHPSRDGHFVQPALTKAAAAKMALDSAFNAAYTGFVMGSPLYFSGGPGGKGIFVVVTSGNDVYALDETTGATVWTKNLGMPAAKSGAHGGCDGINRWASSRHPSSMAAPGRCMSRARWAMRTASPRTPSGH